MTTEYGIAVLFCVPSSRQPGMGIPASYGIHEYNAFLAKNDISTDHANCYTNVNEDNMTPAHRKLFKLHMRMSHQSMRELQHWAKDPVLANKYDLPAEIVTCQIPLCAACQYGKAKMREKTKSTSSIAQNIQSPAEFISVDTLIAGTPR